jgi:hypothetical protein
MALRLATGCCLSILALVPSAAKAESGAVAAPTGLTCQLLSYPAMARISDTIPKFGWIVPLTIEGDRQSAYQILVASTLDQLTSQQGDLWDSGKVNSPDSINVPYAGKPLAPAAICWWQVRTWNRAGDPSNWSAPQQFVIANKVGTYETPHYPLQTVGIAPTSIQLLKPDDYFVDFGKDRFGFLRFDVDSPVAGQTLTVHFGEKLDGPQSIDRKPGGTIRYYQTTIALEKGPKSYEIHAPTDRRNTTSSAIRIPETIGPVAPFRYVELENCPELNSGAIRQMMVHYPFDDDAAEFRSSDERLNRIWDLCKHTIDATTFAGIYIDGDRERIPYEADAYINQLSHYAVDREFAPARHSHEYLLTRPTWPTEWKHHSILMAWADYLYTGNADSLAHSYSMLQKKTLEERARSDGLLASNKQQVGHDDIVDWPASERDSFVFTPMNAVVNAFYYRSLVLMQKIADTLGKTDDAARYQKMAADVLDAFNSTFYDGNRGVYVDGEGTDHASLHANMFALAFDLVPEDRSHRVIEFIKTRSMACSVYGAQYLLEALYKSGEGRYAFDLMTNSTQRGWLHMLDLGSTMTLEAWDASAKPNLDWNHAWGTAPANIISRYLLGVRPLEPGFGKALIQPQPGPLDWVEAKVPTIRGPIQIRVDKHASGSLALKVSIPANMTARIGIPLNSKGKAPRPMVNSKPRQAAIEGSTMWFDGIESGESLLTID